jgi:hypothetical protein
VPLMPECGRGRTMIGWMSPFSAMLPASSVM